jgi:hypothetical protein
VRPARGLETLDRVFPLMLEALEHDVVRVAGGYTAFLQHLGAVGLEAVARLPFLGLYQHELIDPFHGAVDATPSGQIRGIAAPPSG